MTTTHGIGYDGIETGNSANPWYVWRRTLLPAELQGIPFDPEDLDTVPEPILRAACRVLGIADVERAMLGASATGDDDVALWELA